MLIRKSFLLAVVLLSGCASIIDGTSQDVAINTNPSGASCSFVRHDENIGTIASTPGTLHIDKTKYDITITCTKAGYESATYIAKSGNDGATLGNIILGGGIGWGVDSARGADNHYDTPINITLSKK